MNETDSFPPNGLPPEAQEWRRRVEDNIYQLLSGISGNSDSVQGLNRNAASSLETLAGQVRNLSEQVERVNTLYAALPIPDQKTDTATNFGLPSSGWNTVLSVSFVPPGRGRLIISAIGNGQLVSGSTTTNMEVETRLVCGSNTSPATPGLPASPDGVWQNNFLSSWGFEVDTLGGDATVTVSLQIDPVTAASWASGTGSYAVLSARAVFLAS